MQRRSILKLLTIAVAGSGAASPLHAMDKGDGLLDPHLKFFVSIFRGTFPSEAAAIAEAALPVGTVRVAEPIPLTDGGKLLVFQAPASTSDYTGPILVIVSLSKDGEVELWGSDVGWASETDVDGTKTIEKAKALGRDGVRLFKRLEQ